MDRPQLADFLRTRRRALQPEDVGLPRGPRRRTAGLRREEVAALCGMSSDYYTRLEQERGPQPSAPMLAAMAQGLRLSLDERDHLFVLGGHPAPRHPGGSGHVDPGLMRIMDRLQDTPARIINALGEALLQTPPAAALFGGEPPADHEFSRSVVRQWFTDPSSRRIYPAADHAQRQVEFVATLRTAYARDGGGSRTARLVEELLARSDEFAAEWAEHQVSQKHTHLKRFQHPEVGDLELYCQTLFDVDQHQALLVFTAEPGTPSADKLELLAVIGAQQLTPATGPSAPEVHRTNNCSGM
ncbi:helix-turn-helix transcriptional regulator [Arthrobacter sp.]|uniref:helix-turn-helix transcriptional regulator n=1 Tax=Arthrobacter sp. TaxID=1667 RepID=UPI003A9101E5